MTLVRCDFCKASGRPPREPIRHADACPFSDYARGCKLCSALEGTPHATNCPYLSRDENEIRAALARARIERITRGPS